MANRARNPLIVLGIDGRPLAGASVDIFDDQTAIRAKLYSAKTGATELPVPATTNARGSIDGWHNSGAYQAAITGPGIAPYSEFFEIVPGFDASIDPPLLAAHAATHRLGGSDPLSSTAASSAQVLETGQAGQIRAGRVLTVSDFTNIGLNTPLGLWNLSTLNDSSGNGRTLIKGRTVTISLANPAVFTTTGNHGLVAGDILGLQSTGNLPAPFFVTQSLYFWVIATGLTATTFQVSATPGGAAISTLGSTQSGVHTIFSSDPDVGIMGAAAEAVKFHGIAVQAHYIQNATWQQILTGAWGCWFKTFKRGTLQTLIAKKLAGAGASSYALAISATNNVQASVATNGSGGFTQVITGFNDVADDRWHSAIATYDGAMTRLYLDGIPEVSGIDPAGGSLFASSGPFNIGARDANDAASAASPHFGRIDEVFLLGEVPSDDQVRSLYCAGLAHSLGTAPVDIRLNVRRRKRGAPLALTDFPASSVARLYNFVNGALTDLSTNAISLNAGTATTISGPDGLANSAYHFTGTAASAHVSADTALPSTGPRTYGCWFKTNTNNGMAIFAWGTSATADARMGIAGANGQVFAASGTDTVAGPNAVDGLWHHLVCVEDPVSRDKVLRRLYLDGKCVGNSLVANNISVTGGASRFRIGSAADGTVPFIGDVSRVFVASLALTGEQVRNIYNVGNQALPPSPKQETDHVESSETTRILAILDTLESSDTVDLQVMA